jgi:hypothetical protein
VNHLREVLRLWAGNQAASLSWWTRHALRHHRALALTRKVRGSRRDRRAFVFALGPSMRRLDPHKIARLQRTAGFDVVGLNAYATTEFGRIALPDVYVLSDPASWSGTIADVHLQSLDAAGKAEARARARRSVDDTWECIQRTNPLLFVPVERHPVPGYANALPFCGVENLFSSNIDDVTRPLGIRPFTAYRALAVACFLGYREIYVCGIDNDTFRSMAADQGNVLWSRYEHFYDDPATVQPRPSRGVYRGLYYTALAFGCLDAFASQPIVNLDPAGLVDVFPKKHALDVYVDAAAATRR